jgi:hypothetical protein
MESTRIPPAQRASNRSSFTGREYRDNILAGLGPPGPVEKERQLCLRADNPKVHTAQKCRGFCRETGLQILPQPPYSADLAPSDFFLFGHVQLSLAGMTFASHDESFEAILSVVMKIPKDISHRVFDHWLERLDWVAKSKGEYCP